METSTERTRQGGVWGQDFARGARRGVEAMERVLDSGARCREAVGEVLEEVGDSPGQEYRLRRPTSSERLNRALIELGSAAFKIHILLWKWRGAPARGLLPFFTIHSLSRFCSLSRPTVRLALRELLDKGWIRPGRYNKHHKNTLYRLVPIRKVPAPGPALEGAPGRAAEKLEREVLT